MNPQTVITDQITLNISKCIEDTISTHLYKNPKERNIVSKDVLFDYDNRYNILKDNYPVISRKLTDLKFIQKVEEALKSINVKIYYSNLNTIYLSNSWSYTGSQNKKAIFYTDTNLIVEISNMMPTNGASTTIRIFTQYKTIDFIYAHLTYDGSNFSGLPILEEKLQNCNKFTYRYIHPQIYLDYYMFCSTEPESNELIFATSLINSLNYMEKESLSMIEFNESIQKDLEYVNDLHNNVCDEYSKQIQQVECEKNIVLENNNQLKDQIILLEKSNKGLNEFKEK